jgi:short-subunit dehydrogenase involved in D-alanine esterification of teichoic acids
MSRLLDRPAKVLITGGTSGIGAELVRVLLGAGHQVVVLARRASIMPPEPGLFTHDCDLCDPDRVLAVAADVAAAHPDLRILINNAGVQHPLTLLDPASTPLMLREEVMVNLLAPALLARALAPVLIKAGGGAIVNVSSGLAFFPKERAGLYAASKAGLHSFTQSLRYQMDGQGVAVIEVVLPLVDTPMTAGRGTGKISANAAATAILHGLARGKPVIRVGAARALPLIQALVPWLGRRMLRGS